MNDDLSSLFERFNIDKNSISPDMVNNLMNMINNSTNNSNSTQTNNSNTSYNDVTSSRKRN